MRRRQNTMSAREMLDEAFYWNWLYFKDRGQFWLHKVAASLTDNEEEVNGESTKEQTGNSPGD